MKSEITSTGKSVAKAAGLLFCTAFFGLTMATPPEAAGFSLGPPPTSNDSITPLGEIIIRQPDGTIIIIKTPPDAPPPPPPAPPPPRAIPVPPEPSIPEPATILGTVMGAGGLAWFKKRRNEKNKLA